MDHKLNIYIIEDVFDFIRYCNSITLKYKWLSVADVKDYIVDADMEYSYKDNVYGWDILFNIENHFKAIKSECGSIVGWQLNLPEAKMF